MQEHFWKGLALTLLGVLAWREWGRPPAALAQSSTQSGMTGFYVEPGTVDIPLPRGGNAPGKIIIDLETGDTFGYAAFGPDRPYPGSQVIDGRPLVRQPIYLGRFDLSAARRRNAPSAP